MSILKALSFLKNSNNTVTIWFDSLLILKTQTENNRKEPISISRSAVHGSLISFAVKDIRLARCALKKLLIKVFQKAYFEQFI